MLLETFKNFADFQLLDSGNGYRLEQWGEVILQRPDPQVIWPQSLPQEQWDKAWAVFVSPSGGEKGKWEIRQPVPHPWVVKYGELKFLLKLSPFKHTGLFAEQAANWEFMIQKLKDSKIERLKILNLFAYTGGATVVLAQAGYQVTHVDASKPAITWANENYKFNNLPTDSVRWILDDAVKFVKRELKRNAKYHGIIMDPPAFGHGPTGKTWKFNQDLPGLLTDCVHLLADNAQFLVVNGYATNSSALALNNLLQDAIKHRGGQLEFGELCLKQKSNKNERLISTGIFARWQQSA